MHDNERENIANSINGTYYIDEDLQNAMEEFEAAYGDNASEPEESETVEEALTSQQEMIETARSEIEENFQTAKSEMEKISPIEDDFSGIGMGGAYKTSVDVSLAEPKKKGKGFILFTICLICVLVCCIVLGTVYIVRDRKEKDKLVAEASTMTEALTTTTEEATTEEKYDGWIADATVITPTKTEKTISLPAADFSVFEEPEAEEGQEKNEEYDPWTLVTLNLDSVPGSINLTSPGEANQTTQLTSTYMVLVDLDTEEIIAERECEKVIVPASMTKILTVITARDYVSEENLDDTFVITQEIIDETLKSGLSAVGFKPGDEVTVRDMLYGTIVCSGADAAMGLARYCCGTEEAFVERMNENVEQLGLSETAHFTNPVGKYDDDLHCTMTDMAVILNVAMQDDLLRDVLSTRIYHTDTKYPDPNKQTEETGEQTAGENTEEVKEEDLVSIEISNWFLRRIEDKEMLGNLIGAKTGFVNQSGFCSASYYEANNGKRYICVTGNANNSWRAIYDHVGVYRSLTN